MMAIVLVVDDEVELVLGRQDEATRPDLGLIDSLARLHLAVRRFGWSIRLDGPSPAVVELLDFVGLPLETSRQPEVHEPLGVQEEVEPGDLPA